MSPRLSAPAPSTPRPAAGHKLPPTASEVIRANERLRQEEEARARAAGELGFREGWRRPEFWTPERRKHLKIMSWTWPIMVLSAVLLYRRMMGTDELARQEEAERAKNLRQATATSRTSRSPLDAPIADENAPKPLPIVFTKAEREALLKQRAAQQEAQRQQQQQQQQ